MCLCYRWCTIMRGSRGGHGGLGPPPPPHKILLPQIVRRGPRGPCPPPRGPRGPWPPPLQNPGSAYDYTAILYIYYTAIYGGVFRVRVLVSRWTVVEYVCDTSGCPHRWSDNLQVRIYDSFSQKLSTYALV